MATRKPCGKEIYTHIFEDLIRGTLNGLSKVRF